MMHSVETNLWDTDLARKEKGFVVVGAVSNGKESTLPSAVTTLAPGSLVSLLIN